MHFGRINYFLPNATLGLATKYQYSNRVKSPDNADLESEEFSMMKCSTSAEGIFGVNYLIERRVFA